MALPLIPVAIALGASAIFGAFKTGKAIRDNNEAEDLNKSAREIVEEYSKQVEDSRQVCEKLLSELGQTKYDVLTKNVSNFVDIFSQIKNVEFKQDEALNSLHVAEFSDDILQEIKQEISLLTSSPLALAGGAITGAMTAFGAYSGTMALATAGTGTAISSLSGAAATNATLAWLGGGTLSAGGLGVAGGAMMLNAMVAAPALAIAGWYMGNKAEQKLNDAKSNQEIALKFKVDAIAAITLTDGIAEIADALTQILSKVRRYSRRSNTALSKVIKASGLDYQQYSTQDKEVVFTALKLAQLLKAIVDTPILNEEGQLLNDIHATVHRLHDTSKQLIEG